MCVTGYMRHTKVRYLGDIHKLCLFKIGKFWPPFPLLSFYYIFSKSYFGVPPHPQLCRDNKVYERPLARWTVRYAHVDHWYRNCCFTVFPIDYKLQRRHSQEPFNLSLLHGYWNRVKPHFGYNYLLCGPYLSRSGVTTDIFHHIFFHLINKKSFQPLFNKFQKKVLVFTVKI